MNGALFYILLAACSHQGDQCTEVRMTVLRADTRQQCLVILEHEMQSWQPSAPVIAGECVTSLAAAPTWWREAEVASY